jgi:hypothetical protein
MTVTVRAFGTEFSAAPIKQLPSGDWLMTALAHTPRTRPGTTITVKQSEVLDPQNLTALSPAPATIDPSKGLDAMEKAMAAELETLPSAASLLKGVKTVPSRPTQPRMGPQPQGPRP